MAPEWGWAWPANRRLLYNRASADPEGKPWSERKALRLVGRGAGEVDRATTCPTSKPTEAARLPAADGATARTPSRGDDPFIMQADGKALALRARRPRRRTAADALRAAGVAGRRTCSTGSSATRPGRSPRRRVDHYHPSGDEPGSRGLPVRAHDVSPHRAPHGRRHEPVAAVPVRAAAGVVLRGRRPSSPRERGLEHLGWATIVTSRTAIEARVIVTDRMRPLRVAGPAGPPGRAAVPLGAQRDLAPATRRTTWPT